MLKNKKINQQLILNNQLGLWLIFDKVAFLEVKELNMFSEENQVWEDKKLMYDWEKIDVWLIDRRWMTDARPSQEGEVGGS